MVFRRRSKKDEADLEPAPETETAVDDPPARVGPFDAADLTDDDDLPRLDLGGLQIPALPGIEVRLETDPAGGVVAVVLVSGASALQLGAFAAPRSAGIWDEVRAELLETLVADGGNGRERDGTFGVELLATVPAPQGRQSARFVGIDGPRWFLRGVFTGPAATDPLRAAGLEAALRQVVVTRGGDPLPVRDPLPLVLPTEVLAPPGDVEEEDAVGPELPEMPERGPEITETR